MTNQADLLHYISEYIDENGYSPSIRELCKAFKIRSTSTMYTRLERLRAEGKVTWEYGCPRTLRLM
jgi:repressor LexA